MSKETAQNERDTWAAMTDHISPGSCHTCCVAYSRDTSDAECMAALCVDGREARQAWLDAFAANGHRSG